MNPTDILEVVKDLNSSPYKGGKWYPEEWEVLPFSFHSDGHISRVEFMGLAFWDSENDEREYLEELDDYEPLDEYLTREVSKYIDQLLSLKKGLTGSC